MVFPHRLRRTRGLPNDVTTREPVGSGSNKSAASFLRLASRQVEFARVPAAAQSRADGCWYDAARRTKLCPLSTGPHHGPVLLSCCALHVAYFVARGPGPQPHFLPQGGPGLFVLSVDLQQKSPQPVRQILGRLIAPPQLLPDSLPNGLVTAAQIPDVS